MWIAALVSGAWVNRRDVVRWTEFIRRVVQQRESRTMSEWLTEAKVRAAVTADPVLRRDPALQDVAVNGGIVTLFTNTAEWPDSGAHVRRLTRVKGVDDVKSLPLVDA